MKAVLAILVMAVMTEAMALSFEKEVGAYLKDLTDEVTTAEAVRWHDIKIKGSHLVAILENEMEELNRTEEKELISERANQICRWTGFEVAEDFSLKSNHQIFKFETRWFLLSEDSGDHPAWADLEAVEVAPNSQLLTTSFINTLVKVEGAGRTVTLRSGSPKSFSWISCVR